MKILRTSLTTVSPRALEELLHRRSVTFYNAPRELRQPLGIYGLSLTNIWESFKEVLDELDNVLKEQVFRQEPPVRWDKTLIRRQEDLISHLMRHFDDCLSLLSCFYPKTHVTPEEDKKYVMKQSPVKVAMDAARPYRDHIANMMNHMKHQQGMLRGVVVFNANTAIPGYFVEHIDQNEVLEPHPNVHTLYQGESTAFSFFRDLRYKFWIVYAVSEFVADAITTIAMPTPNVFAKVGADADIVEIARRIAALPTQTFKDEARLDFPYVGLDNVASLTQITIEYPSQTAVLLALSGVYNVSTGWTGDDVTRSFRPPYFNP